MARASSDLRLLRGAFGVLGIALLLSAAMLAASYWFVDAMRSEYQRHHNRFLQVSRKYLAVDEEERMVRNNYPRFVQLYNRGIIGRENRLDWLETLRGAGERIRIPQLRYSIDSREPFEADFRIDTGAYQVYASGMELDLLLLHEGDFIALTDILEREARGLYRIASCTFERITEQIERDPERPNLRAGCELEWLTVNLPGGEEIEL